MLIWISAFLIFLVFSLTYNKAFGYTPKKNTKLPFKILYSIIHVISVRMYMIAMFIKRKQIQKLNRCELRATNNKKKSFLFVII